jgi:FlaA1/EpsC-like NDP-sugar epimerase
MIRSRDDCLLPFPCDGNMADPFTLIKRPRHLAYSIALIPVLAMIQFAAYWLRFDGQLGAAEMHVLWSTLVWAVLVKTAVFTWFGIYQSWDSYVSFHDLVSLSKAATLSSVLLAMGDYLFWSDVIVPRSVFLLDWGITIVTIGGLRSIGRMLAERELPAFLAAGKTPVLIVGANNSGEALLRMIRREPKLPYRVVGFISEAQSSPGTRIGGVPILGQIEQTADLAEKLRIPEVLIAAGELSGKRVRQLMDDARNRNVTVKVLPSYEQMLRGHLDLRPRTVSIEDLLHRDPIRLDIAELHQWIDGHVLLVTGSAGSIGSEICRQLLQFSPQKVVLVDRSETGQFFLERELQRLAPSVNLEVCMADINDSERMAAIFRTHRPEIVFHAAAYKHVPLMESNMGEAVKNIALATRTVADLANRYHAKSFVQISTDKAVNPTSIMGACKRVAELYIQSLSERSECRFVTVRFGNVLDSAGSVVPIFREQIAAGGPVTVTHPDMTRYFMTIPEASQLVIQAGAMGRGGEIFVLDMGEPMKIIDLAKDMIRLSGLQVDEDIEIDFTGLRPGEKLFEELHVDGEEHSPTSHPNILISVCDRKDLEEVSDSLERLAQLADQAPDRIRMELARIVPQFQGHIPTIATTPRRLAA